MSEAKVLKKTSIGGQALIEGVMMRGPDKTAMAVRLPDGSIDVETWENPPAFKSWYRKTPLVRGVFNFVDSMLQGYKCLMKSANKAGFEDEEPSKFEKWLSDKLGASMSSVVSVVALILGVALAIGLFVIIPTALSGWLGYLLDLPQFARTIIEGVMKIIIFILYLALVSRTPDIRRVFEYHGAEHKTIACYEASEELTPENVARFTRFHPRCGTSFILIVLVISILVFSVVTWKSLIIRIILKLLLLPLVVSISYEIIKFAGRHDNPLTRVISAPGLWLQRLTTSEPQLDQIAVAIASVTPVIPNDESDVW